MKGQDIKSLFGSDSEINSMTPAYKAKLYL